MTYWPRIVAALILGVIAAGLSAVTLAFATAAHWMHPWEDQ